MSKIKKHPSLNEYDEGYEDRIEIVNIGLIELGEMIEEKLDHPIDRRNKQLTKMWKKEVNWLVEQYNLKAGFTAYKHVY